MRSYNDVLSFVKEENIKFIKLAFIDAFGVPKNLAVIPEELERAFREGISFDASAVDGYDDGVKSDMFLNPDPDTLTIVPWRPMEGRVARMFCDVTNPDGTLYPKDTRYILKQAIRAAKEAGIYVYFGAEVEFYLFRLDEKGMQTRIPLDNAGYMDIAPDDQGEAIRRDICYALIDMGIHPETSHHEQGPGQNEIDFRYSTALNAADNVITFKQVVSTIAARNGLWASFLPKPIADAPGNGFHMNISLVRASDGQVPEDAVNQAFMAGIMAHTPELTAVLNPLESSYQRLGKEKAPDRVSWSPNNRSQLIRIPAADALHQRIELRSPDATANPYLAFALVIRAGLDGILQKMTPPAPCDLDLLQCPEEVRRQYPALPKDLAEARRLLGESEFIREALPAHLFSAYTA